MFELNENTYVSLQDADDYINEHYQKHHPLRVHWSVLEDTEKQTYLLQSTAQIEKLPFIGRKAFITQSMAFPRVRERRAFASMLEFRLTYGVTTEIIPTSVKQAEIENALDIIMEQIKSVSDKQFLTMQSLGAVKNTKYNKREAGDLGFGAELTGGMQQKCPISSAKAYNLLREWIGGGYAC